MQIKVVLIDDHALIREGLTNILQNNSRIQVVNEFSTKENLFEYINNNSVDIFLMDINLPELSGIDLTKELVKKAPEAKIIGLSMVDDVRYIKKMLNSGASGYVLKSSSSHELIEAIIQVHEGGTYYCKEVTSIVMSNMRKKSSRSSSKANTPLTVREKEVLSLIVKEYSNKEIADALFVSLKTVDTHKRNLMLKTGSKSPAGLVLYAMNNGLLEDY